MKNLYGKISAGLTALFVSSMAMAAGTYDTITAAVNWSEVTAAVVAIGALIAAVYVVVKGVKMILRAIKGA